MDAQREKELIELLNKYDTAGVPFYQARQKILAKGFTEAELVYGLYSAPFDGRANNKPVPTNPLQKLYENDPERAAKIAKILLLDQAQDQDTKTTAYMAGSALGPDIQSRAYYGLRASDELGIPYFTILAIIMVLLVIGVALHISSETINTIILALNTLLMVVFGYKLIRKKRAIKKLKKDVRELG